MVVNLLKLFSNLIKRIKRPAIDANHPGSTASVSSNSRSRAYSASSATSKHTRLPGFARSLTAPETREIRYGVSHYVMERRARLNSPDPSYMGDIMTMDQRREQVLLLHDASDRWCELYEKYPIGTIPTPEECKDAPPTQSSLQYIPIQQTSARSPVLGHFFKRVVGDDGKSFFKCQILVNGVVCGQQYSTSSSADGRTGHLNGMDHHRSLLIALDEFQTYQHRIKGVPSKRIFNDASTPSARFAAVRAETVESNMRKALPHERQEFLDHLLNFVVDGKASFNLLSQPCVFKLVTFLNVNFRVPTVRALQNRLNVRVTQEKETITKFLFANVDSVAITLDGWTSIDKRKYLGVTCHFFTTLLPEMMTFVIGMERTHGSQTGDAVLETLRK